MNLTKKERLKKRHLRVRKKVAGTSERPRLCVRKSLKHVHASVIDDSSVTGSKTLAAYTTATKSNGGKHMRNVESAAALGKTIGADLLAKGIKEIVFDRGGYRYHGCVKALADSVREAGVKV